MKTILCVLFVGVLILSGCVTNKNIRFNHSTSHLKIVYDLNNLCHGNDLALIAQQTKVLRRILLHNDGVRLAKTAFNTLHYCHSQVALINFFDNLNTQAITFF